MPRVTDEAPPGRIVKHSVAIAGHRTSISLEQAFWTALREAAAERGSPLARLIGEIDAGRGEANLSSAIRVHLLGRAYFVGGALAENAGGSGTSK